MVEKSTGTTFFPVGIILKGHGLKGEVKVRPLALNTDFLTNGQELIANFPDGDVRSLSIQQVRANGQSLLLTFHGINDRDGAEELRGVELTINREALPPLEEGEFYLGDLIGYTVLSDEQDQLGHIHEVWDMPANEVLRVVDQDRETLIPLVDDFIESIDHHQHRVIIRLMDGLLD
jgi:16S rRNA processing protein RimM